MKIRIKTSLVTLEIEDEADYTGNMTTNHVLPELMPAIKCAIDEAIRLHNEVNKQQ